MKRQTLLACGLGLITLLVVSPIGCGSSAPKKAAKAKTGKAKTALKTSPIVNKAQAPPPFLPDSVVEPSAEALPSESSREKNSAETSPGKPTTPAPRASANSAIPTSVPRPEGVKLVPFDFVLKGVQLTILAPEGAMIDKEGTFLQIVAGERFGISVCPHFDYMSVEDLQNGPVIRQLADFVVSGPKAVLIKYKEKDGFQMRAGKTVGHVDYCLNSLPKFYDPAMGKVSLDDMKLMLYCCTTLERKSPIPDDPAVLLEQLEATLEKDAEGNVIGVTTPGLGGSVTNSTMELLLKFPKLKKLHLVNCVGDKGLVHVAKLKGIEELEINITQITTDGLKALEGFTSLRTLKIGPNGNLEPECLVHFQNAKDLTVLDLSSFYLKDEGLPPVLKFVGLKELSLRDTKVTDEGLKTLVVLKNLKMLNLSDTKVSSAEVAELQKALPECKIVKEK